MCPSRARHPTDYLWDKSGALVLTLNKFYYFDKDPQAGTLKGVVRYTLNRPAAETVTIRFYDPDLDEFSGSALTGQDNTAGTHWSDVYTLTGVEFDQNGEPVGPISYVLFADESATDAANNRDSEPKPALQKGSTDLEYTPVGLKEVSFASASGDANCHIVVRDEDDEDVYSVPQWQDNSTPPDYDADDGEEFATGADHKYPVCYRWDSAMNASCVIEGKTPWGTLQQGDVYIRGDGDGDLDFPARAAQVAAGPPATATYPATDSTGELPAAVQRMGAFRVVWEISTDEGSTWHYAGTSENEVFVYRPRAQGTEAPGCGTNWRTLLYLACNGGGTDDDSIYAATWAEFSDLEVLAWDTTSRSYSRLLKYWENNSPSQDAAGMLETANGSCVAWAQLLLESLGVNHLRGQWPEGQRSVITEVLPPDGNGYGFAVPNVGAPQGQPLHPTEPDGYVWDLSQLDFAVSGAPAQGISTPAAKAFESHFIVHRRFGTYPYYDHNWYDPSCAEMWGGESDFTDNGVVYWIKRLQTDPDIWGAKLRTGNDEMVVDFDDGLVW